MKDLKFVNFTDAISILSINYYSIKMKDESLFIFTGIETLDSIKRYGYQESDYSIVTLRMQVSPTSSFINRVLYSNALELSFSAVGKGYIDVIIPVRDIIPGASILSSTSYYITSSALVTADRVEMDFAIPAREFQPVEGVLKLSQQVIKILLSKVRSNRYLLSEGTDILSLLGNVSTPVKISEVFQESLEATENFIIERQNTSVASFFTVAGSFDDKLSSLSLISVTIDENNPDRAEVLIQMRTASGDAVTIPIIL